VFFSSTGQKDMKATQVNTTAKEKAKKLVEKDLEKAKVKRVNTLKIQINYLSTIENIFNAVKNARFEEQQIERHLKEKLDQPLKKK